MSGNQIAPSRLSLGLVKLQYSHVSPAVCGGHRLHSKILKSRRKVGLYSLTKSRRCPQTQNSDISDRGCGRQTSVCQPKTKVGNSLRSRGLEILRDAQYCQGFFAGAGKVFRNRWDYKVEVTARQEFQAAVLVFEQLYGGVVRPTEGSQGTPAVKWTWSGGSGRCKETLRRETKQLSELDTDRGRRRTSRFRSCMPDIDVRQLLNTACEPKSFVDVCISWNFLAGLFDAVAYVRPNRGQIIVVLTHRNFKLLDSVRQFLVAVGEEASSIFLQHFHRRSRLLLFSNLSQRVLLKLLKSLRVRRRAVELLIKGSPKVSLADLNLIASAQAAYLGRNDVVGKLRLIPKSQSFKRHLEFEARQEDAKEVRHLLELGTDLKMLKLLEDCKS